MAKPKPPASANTLTADLADRDLDTLTDAEISARYAAAKAACSRAFKLMLLRSAETRLADLNRTLDGAGVRREEPGGEADARGGD
jgi:hypothetical protein